MAGDKYLEPETNGRNPNERERERERFFAAVEQLLEILRPTRKPWAAAGRKEAATAPAVRPSVRDGERRRRTGTKTMRSAVENSF
ncbi:unnamed protein product [Sphagnum troendelagicum]|jgi:hypothetical protein